MTTQGMMHLRDLVRALGWSYATLWALPNLSNTELVWADGCFEANPMKSYDSEYWDVERLFSSSYKACAFTPGCGYVGRVLQDGQPLWLNGIDVLIHHSNTSSQAHFFKVAGIQTLLCIPWFNSVVELGSSSFLTRDAHLLTQIRSFLSHIPTPKQPPMTANAYLPIESSTFLSQDLSAGSDDASFNGGLNRDQQVESFPKPKEASSLAGEISRSTQQFCTPKHHFRETVVSGESELERLDFGSSEEMLQTTLRSSPARSTLPKQQKPQQQKEGGGVVEMVMAGADFSSSFSICPPQKMSLLGQLEYNQSFSTSHSSSSRGDDDNTNNLPSVSYGISEAQQQQQQQSDNDHYYFPQTLAAAENNQSGNESPATAGFMPWTSTPAAHDSVPRIRRSSSSDSNSNQVLLRRSISMTHKIPQLNASRETQQQRGVVEQIADVRQRAVVSSTPAEEEVLSGHHEAAVNHMLAERKRRQKQKENFSALRSLIPFVSKMDRASILGDAISYVKQLTARVEELEFLNRELEAQFPGLQRKRSRSSTITS